MKVESKDQGNKVEKGCMQIEVSQPKEPSFLHQVCKKL